MSEVGIRVSQQGYSAKSDPDYRQSFTSTAATLPILAQGEVTLAGAVFPPVKQTIYKHDLGYIPMFITHDISEAGSRSTFNNDGSQTLHINKNELYSSGASVAGARIFWTIFKIDLTKELLPDGKTGNDSNIDADSKQNYGVRVAKEGYDIRSRDLRQFVTHSDARSVSIHSIKTFSKSSGFLPAGQSLATVKHDLGYAPIFLIYGTDILGSDNDVYDFYYVAPEGGIGISAKSTTTDVIVNDTSNAARTCVVVILKDPMALV